jgi:hypothetical protein
LTKNTLLVFLEAFHTKPQLVGKPSCALFITVLVKFVIDGHTTIRSNRSITPCICTSTKKAVPTLASELIGLDIRHLDILIRVIRVDIPPFFKKGYFINTT